MAEEKTNIFDLADKLGFESPFNDWVTEQKKESEIAKMNHRIRLRQKRLAKKDNLGLNSEKNVFLTFDDGLQPGTEEVLLVLKKFNIKATFFLTGIHVKSFIEKIDRGLGLRMLKEIYYSHQIGNHSYSHANDFYENYYKNGLKVGKGNDGRFIYRTVLDDFKLNDELINYYLNQAGVDVPLGKQYKIARFPGRNTWYDDQIQDAVADTEDEAKELYKAGYRLYGWDTEWNMNFQVVNIAKADIQTSEDKGKLDWNNEEHTHPFYDLYSDALIDKDRLNETASEIKDDIEDFAYWSLQPGDDFSKSLGNVIVLMHERAFRYQKNKNTSEAYKLANLIVNLKRLGFNFKTMNEYE